MKKKVIMTTITILTCLLLGGGMTLFTIGKTANIETNIQLEKVPSDVEHVLYYASFAANSHNTQSWEITLTPNQKELNIFLDKERSLDVVDPDNRELYISIGCYLQSLKTAFEAYGYDISLNNLTPSEENSYQVATVTYQKSENSEVNNQQIELIKKRHTDKRKFETTSIDKEVISNLVQKYSNIYYFVRESDEFNYLQKGSIAAAKEQYQSQAFLEEQGQWLRFSNQEVEEKKDGISGDMLGLSPLVKTLYYLTTNHQNASSESFVKQSTNTLTNQVENCAGFFVITGGQSISDWITVGQQTQAFWYDCVENDIAIQPISAMIEVASYSQFLQEDLDVSQPVQMILRAGYVKDYGENAGTRRDLNDYITVINN